LPAELVCVLRGSVNFRIWYLLLSFAPDSSASFGNNQSAEHKNFNHVKKALYNNFYTGILNKQKAKTLTEFAKITQNIKDHLKKTL
jgi:hypothetical protein